MRRILFHDGFMPMMSVWLILFSLEFMFLPGRVLSDEPLILQPDKDGVQRATIKMESYAFSPNKLIVAQGKPVELTLQNDSFLVPHNFLLDSPEGERLLEENVSSGEIETVQFTLTTSGTYSFYCDKQLLFFPNHREEGMEGTIIVR